MIHSLFIAVVCLYPEKSFHRIANFREVSLAPHAHFAILQSKINSVK